MKFELERNEVLEQMREVEKTSQMEMDPPMLERTTDNSEQPPKLGAAFETPEDAQEYYKAKKEKLQAEMDEMRRQQTLRRAEVNYGTPTTESGWKDEAAKEYAKWGKETSYYNYCMKQAAKAHVNGK